MRKLLAIVLLGASLAGCAGLGDRLNTSVLSGGLSLTASVQNPVTEERLLQVQQAIDVAFTGLNAYRRLCTVDRVLPPSCFATITKLQTYTVRVKPMLVQLRRFVRSNDQVNAIIVFNTMQTLLLDLKTFGATQGVI